MNKDIDLIEILKDAPRGTKLWSPICGECELYSINISTDTIRCFIKDSDDFTLLTFDSKGRYFGFSNSGEYMLFPSKNNRDWSTFKAPWKHKHFEPFQKVLVSASDNDDEYDVWAADFYSHYRNGLHYALSGIEVSDDEIISYEGNEDKLGKQVSE